MFPYLQGPEAGDVEAALCAGDLKALRARLDTRLAEADDPELRHVLGLLEFCFCDFHRAGEQLERAFHALRLGGRPRPAALVAVSLGRLYFDGVGNEPVGRGWLARAASLLDGEDPCVEQGWALLGLVGCSVADAAELETKAEGTLQLARRFGDAELESKALADRGLALVSLGRTIEGMRQLDESMTMLRSGECPNPLVGSQIVCDLISACERAGDLPRAEAWITTLEEMRFVRPPDQKPSFLFTHCRVAYGMVLCHAGRWSAAETALRLALSTSRDSGYNHQAASRGALADLLVQQGRLEAAAALLDGHDDRVEALTPLARLHLARGDYDLAAAVARQGLRLLGGDRLRAAPLLLVVVDAELGRGNVDAAEEAVALLAALAAGADTSMSAALAARAEGRLAASRGEAAAAVSAFEGGLRAVADGWPLLRAALHLDLAGVQAERDRGAAVAEARAALAVCEHVDAPAVEEEAAAMLRRLGERVLVEPRRAGPLAVLTRREREVFDLVAQGLSNPAIARRLFVTPKTVEHHVGSILGKLGLRGRAEVVAYAVTVSTPELVAG